MTCKICKSTKLKTILNLGNQYLSEFRRDDEKPAQFPLELIVCKDCKQVQLRDVVPQNLLYTDNYGYRSGINATMRNHLEDLVIDICGKADLKSGDSVADIGSNDGTLLKNYPTYAKRYGYDLVPKFKECYKNTGITFTNELFGTDQLRFRVITAISMFYDIEDPVKFMQLMADRLDKKGIIVIQQNYLLTMLQKNGYDNIVSEHIFYHSVSSMKKIAELCGLEIVSVKVNDLNGGSFRTYICHKDEYKVSESVQKWLDHENDYGLNDLDCYREFADRVFKVATGLEDFLNQLKEEGKVVAVCGASTRGNTLLQFCDIDSSLVECAIERNPEKYGTKIASVGIPIISEEEAEQRKIDYYLVLPWFFEKEITKRYDSFRKKGGKLIFPLPEVKIV